MSDRLKPTRRQLLTGVRDLTLAAVTITALDPFAKIAEACGVSNLPRHNDDISRVRVGERRMVFDNAGNLLRTEPGNGNQHLLIAPTRAQLAELGSGDIADFAPDRFHAMGLRAVFLQTKIGDELVPGYGRLWTMRVAGYDNQGKPKWAWGANIATVVGYPEFTKNFRDCPEDELPAHLIRLYRVKLNADGGYRLALHHEEVVAVNCTPLEILTTARATEVPSQPQPQPTPTSVPEGPKPAPDQTPPPGPGAPQIPVRKSEIVIEPGSEVALGGPFRE